MRSGLEGTVSGISSEPPCRDGNIRFKNELDIHVYNSENWLFSIVDSLQT